MRKEYFIWTLRRKARLFFTVELPSNIPGMNHIATVRACWTRTGRIQDELVKDALIRLEIRERLATITSNQSVFNGPTVQDQITVAMHHMTIDLDGETLQISCDVRLKPVSNHLTRHQGGARRRWRRSRPAMPELSRLLALRDTVMSDPILARIWWLNQPAELVAAVGSAWFDEFMKAVAATRERSNITKKGVVDVLADFALWLDADEHRATLAVAVLEKMLTVFDRKELLDLLYKSTGRSTHDQ